MKNTTSVETWAKAWRDDSQENKCKVGVPSLGHSHLNLLFKWIFFLLNSKGPQETCNQGSDGQWQLTPGLPPEPVSKAQFL